MAAAEEAEGAGRGRGGGAGPRAQRPPAARLSDATAAATVCGRLLGSVQKAARLTGATLKEPLPAESFRAVKQHFKTEGR